MTGAFPIRFAFVGLIDCAIPVVAHELGFAAKYGLALDLNREVSWAGLRDKLAFGIYDAAHILAGLPIASTLGLGGGPAVPMIAPMALGLGGNAITVSVALYNRMCELDPDAMAGKPGRSVRALAKVVRADQAAKKPPLSFATVFPFSSHNYELRYWLAAGGIDPDHDINLSIIAPPRMSENLRAGWIDGYCVGEPWNLRAVQRGHGVIIASKEDIWPASPEKVLGLRAEWAAAHPEQVTALVQSFVEAAEWADAPHNRAQLAELLARDDYLGAPVNLLRAALLGQPVMRPGQAPMQAPNRHIFFRWQATFPFVSRAAWLMTQMQRWGQLRENVDIMTIASQVFRPDLYQTAVAPMGLAVPMTDTLTIGHQDAPYRVAASLGGTVELGPDRFFDGRIFDLTATKND